MAASTYTQVAEALTRTLGAIDGVPVFDHEPREIPLPAITIDGPVEVRRSGVDQAESQLGANDHYVMWAVRIYVALDDPQVAERERRTLLGQLIDVLDANQTLGLPGLVLDTKLATVIHLDSPSDQPRQSRIYECHVETWLLVT